MKREREEKERESEEKGERKRERGRVCRCVICAGMSLVCSV